MKPIDGDALAERVMYKFIYDPDYTLEDAIYDIQDAEELEEVVEVVRCKDCKHRGTDDCPMYFEEQVEWEEDGGYIEHDTICHDYTEDDGFCDRGERRQDE